MAWDSPRMPGARPRPQKHDGFARCDVVGFRALGFRVCVVVVVLRCASHRLWVVLFLCDLAGRFGDALRSLTVSGAGACMTVFLGLQGIGYTVQGSGLGLRNCKISCC